MFAKMDRLLREDQVAERLGISISKLQKHRVYGGGPPFRKLGAKKNSAVRYCADEVDLWALAGGCQKLRCSGGR